MLVRAGMLEPRVTGQPRLSGQQLVGWRVRVYWPGDDCMYSGLVVAYDASAGTHEIQYDDGDCVLEVLGSALAPEYAAVAS